MVGLLQNVGRTHLWQSVILVLLVAIINNVVIVSHKAMAGGAIMVGHTIVTGGEDRVSGETYRAFPDGLKALVDPRRFLPRPSVIRAYPGDQVTFTGIIWNVDPFPIPGFSLLAVQQKDFDDRLNLLNPVQYLGHPPVERKLVYTFGTGVPVVPGISNFVMNPDPVKLSSNAKPGQQLCQFVSTAPMFYLGFIPVIPYFEWKIPDLVNINLRFKKGDINTSFTDANNGNDYGIQTDTTGATDGPIAGNDGATYDVHSTWSVQFGRMMSCAEIVYVYDLEPTLTLDETNSTSTIMNVIPAVNEGNYEVLQSDAPRATETQPTEWQISQLLIPDNQTPPTGFKEFDDRLGSDDVCRYYSSRQYGYVCTVLEKAVGRDKVTFSSGKIGDPLGINSGKTFPASVSAPPTIPAGLKLCYVLSVNSHRPVYPEWNSRWRSSPIVCSTRTSVKKPKVQVHGDDVRVGGKITTSLSSAFGSTYGSWGQYASYSVGDVKDFATASGLKGGKPDGTSQPAFSALTFASILSASPPIFGQFDNNKANVSSTGLTSVKNYFSSLSNTSLASASVSLTSLSSSTKPYFFPGNLDISGGSIDKGKTIIIIATGKVTVQSDIKYTSVPLSGVEEIPQVVIVAKDIDIDESVKNIDAWLIADSNSGVINTCAQVPNTQDLTFDKCKNPLTVNGPVVTNRLLLHRTNGSKGTTSDTLGEPAETFKNMGESYLWAWNYFRNNNGLISTKQTELPPRF